MKTKLPPALEAPYLEKAVKVGLQRDGGPFGPARTVKSICHEIRSLYLRTPKRRRGGGRPRTCECGTCPKCKNRLAVAAWRAKQKGKHEATQPISMV